MERVRTALAFGAGRQAIRETVHVDLKEEAGRRDRRGALQFATERSDAAVDALAR